jgi:hypothetical protein
MRYRAIEKYKSDLINNIKICFKCEEAISAEITTFNCLKCLRAFYCSPKCLKQHKYQHDMVCRKYYKYYQAVDDLVKDYAEK